MLRSWLSFVELSISQILRTCSAVSELLLTFGMEVLLIEGLKSAFEEEMEDTQINYWAHIGGFVGGLVVMEMMNRIHQHIDCILI